MTEQESRPAAEQLQPLDFRPVPFDGNAAIFRAEVGDKSVPESPVFALTVTIDLDTFNQHEQEFIAFLGDMRAAFRILPGPDLQAGGPGDAFDIKTQILIEPELVSHLGTGQANVRATVATATGGTLRGKPPAGAAMDHTVSPGKPHHWRSKHGFSTGTVIPSQGKGIMRPPRTPVWYGHQGQLYAREITVQSDQGMDYDFQGDFRGP